MTQRTEGPDLRRNLARLDARVKVLERRSGVRPTDQRPQGPFVRLAGDTMTGPLTMDADHHINASRGLRIGELYGETGLLRVGGPIKFAAEGFDWRNGANGFLASLDINGNLKASGFNVGDAGEQRMEMHRHDGAAYLHFYAPGESFHGNLYQDFVGAAGTTRQARINFHTSQMASGVDASIKMLSRSDNGTVEPRIDLDAGNGYVKLTAWTEVRTDGPTWLVDPLADRAFLVGVGGNCRVVNANNSAFRPIEASAFTVSSDPAIKGDIRSAPANMTEALRAVNVIRYRMRGDWDDGSGAEHIGVESTSLPVIMQRPMTTAEGTITGYDVPAAVAWLCGVAKEMDGRLRTVEARR